MNYLQNPLIFLHRPHHHHPQKTRALPRRRLRARASPPCETWELKEQQLVPASSKWLLWLGPGSSTCADEAMEAKRVDTISARVDAAVSAPGRTVGRAWWLMIRPCMSEKKASRQTPRVKNGNLIFASLVGRKSNREQSSLSYVLFWWIRRLINATVTTALTKNATF